MGYHDILAFYFPGTAPGVTGRGLSWVRLSGESVSLFSTQPEQDRAALAIAERLAKEIAGETGLAANGPIEIRAYPDVETFRNATGEPGWVAAHTSGRRVDLQPVAVLRGKGVLESTVRHELLHVLVETQAKAGLPVWFREGVVGYLERRHGGGADLTEGDIRQTTDEARARRAYAAAAQRVTELVQRHGAATVLSWLKTGIP
jgi:stage II sporulation protein D